MAAPVVDYSNYLDIKKDEAFLLSAKAVIVKEKKVLVLKFPPQDVTALASAWNGKWGLPGGLVEMNESVPHGLLREINEEVGLKVEIGHVFGIGEMKLGKFIFRDGRDSKVRIIEIGYICSYAAGDVVLSLEHSGHRWVTLGQLKNLEFSPDSIDLIKLYIEKYGKE